MNKSFVLILVFGPSKLWELRSLNNLGKNKLKTLPMI
jgi:hypothetical protein